MSVIPETIGNDDDLTSNGISTVLTCWRDGLANKWRCKSGRMGNQLCLPLKAH